MKAVAGRSNKSWIAVAMRIAVGVSLLIVPAQLCLASDARREAADGWWSAWGKNVKTELNALPDAGRKAFRDALIACSLYADEYNSDVRGAECKRAVKAFTVEYGRDHSPIELTFNTAIITTRLWAANLELERQHGQRDVMDNHLRYGYLDVLQRAYGETLTRETVTSRPTGLSDAEIAANIVKQSRAAYYATGHPCACPEDLARNGSRCGERSAYSRPGGAMPYCYVSDVPTAEIEAYRAGRLGH